jgi:nucleoid-associated protein YgaU
VAGAAIVSLAFIPSCAKLDPDYAEYKKQKNAEASDPYGAPSLGSNNPYAVPGANGETGAPYQPLPGVTNYPPVVEDMPTPTEPYSPIPAEPTAEASTHIVVKGDTIWGLTKKYDITADALREANNLTTDVIWIGQRLIIPAR